MGMKMTLTNWTMPLICKCAGPHRPMAHWEMQLSNVRILGPHLAS